MARFLPFPGLRYSRSHISSLDDVVCPPYDVISEEERVALVARSALNAVLLELPRAEDENEDPYQAAAELLDAWRDGGVLHREQEPSFYGYRMLFTDQAGVARATVGVVGALRLEPAGTHILPHEQTTPKAKSDRLQLLTATRANLSPIWGLSPTAGLSELCQPPAHPVEHVLDEEGVTHEVWPIVDPAQVEALSSLVSSQPVLIADGHHRYETALAYQGSQPADDLGAGFVMALVVELADEQLSVEAIHRLVVDLPEGFDLVAALDDTFDLEATEPVDAGIGERMGQAGALAVVTRAGTWLARPRPSTLAAAAHPLDSSRLDVALAALPAHQLVYQHGWAQSAAAVGTGQADAAILLRPASVEQIAAVSRGGERMPPKTTFFWPKPRTGLVMRELIA